MSNILRSFVDKCFSLSRLGKNWLDSLINGIVEAGRTISYVETTTPSRADSLHIAIKECDNKVFMREFEKVVRFAIKKLNLEKVKLAFDTTEDLTWISYSHNIRPSVYEHPIMSWQYLNLSIVEPYFLPLMSVPYRQVDDLDNLVIDLINYVKTLPLIVDLALFDRGFYHARLIDYMNNAKGGKPFPYLMLVPQKQAQKDYVQQTRDANLSFASYKHTFNYKKDKSSWKPLTRIITRIIDEKTAWCYATNKEPSIILCKDYGKRWNIETGFRIHDETKIKSKSKNQKIRFFYHITGMLIVTLWKIQNFIKTIVFKRYLKLLEEHYNHKIEDYYPPPL